MIKQYSRYNNYNWNIIVYYNVNADDKQDILEMLYYLHCTGTKAKTAVNLMSELNKGFTYTNHYTKTSFVCISETTSKDELINSIAHEAKHIMEHICVNYNIPLEGEISAYMLGEIVMLMFDTFKLLL